MIALEESSQVIVSHLAYESGFHPENGCTGHSIGSRASCNKLYSQRFEDLPYLVPGLHVHMLHAPFRKFHLLQQAVVRQECQNIRKCISDA